MSDTIQIDTNSIIHHISELVYLPILMEIKGHINQMVVVVSYYMVSVGIEHNFLFATLFNKIYDAN